MEKEITVMPVCKSILDYPQGTLELLRAEQLGRELFRTGAAITFKEKAGFTDMMFYKMLILP